MCNDFIESVRPDYKIYQFSDHNYKIVKFKSTLPRVLSVDRKDFQKYDKKLDQSLSRARRNVLELALCNNWKYFCTFTIAEANHDRKDLKGFYKRFSQWLRDTKKKYIAQGISLDMRFLLIPEKHKDGSWHMHGLFGDISPVLVSFSRLDHNGWNVPEHLVDEGYYCWFDYWMKFGFCSIGRINNFEAASVYVAKYVTKSLGQDCDSVGLHTYYCSQGLKRPRLHGDVFGESSKLDKYLDRDYDFCQVGMTYAVNQLDWSFGLDYMDFDEIEIYHPPDSESYFPEVDVFVDCTQLNFMDGVINA